MRRIRRPAAPQPAAIAPSAAEEEEEEEKWHECSSELDYEEGAVAAPLLLSPGGPLLPIEPLDEDEELPPLPDNYPVPERARSEALRALRSLILAAPDATEVAALEDRSPATLTRFLRARDFDARVAAALFLDHRAWRRSFGWAVPGSSVPQRYIANGTICLQALSRHGRPLLVIVVRRHTLEGREMESTRQFIIHTMDRIMDAQRPGGQFLVLVDFEGLSRKSADVKALIACFEILQKGYPERVKHLWFAEPPALFWGLWQAIKPFVAPKTKEKIVFLYGKAVADTLRAHFNAEDVPVEYGGTGQLRPIHPGPCVWEQQGAQRRRKY
jgi:hypothetical protein